MNQLYKNINRFNDIKIILKDDFNIENLFLHRIILSTYVPYFDKLFSNKFSEDNLNEIEIFVPNSKIRSDIILSIYGKNIENDILNSCDYLICKDFLGFPINKKDTLNLIVDDENIIIFLDICFIIGYDQMIEQILKKVPSTYNFESYDMKLFNKINDLNNSKIITIDTDDNIIILNYTNGEIINQYRCSYNNIEYDNYIFDDKNLIAYFNNDNKNYYIHDTESGNLLKNIKIDGGTFMTFDYYRNNIVLLIKKEDILYIYDINNVVIKGIILPKHDCNCKLYSTIFNNMIILYCDKYIDIYDFTKVDIIKSIYLSQYNMIILLYCDKYIDIYDFTKVDIIKSIDINTLHNYNIAYFSAINIDNEYIYIGCGSGNIFIIKIDNIYNELILKSLEYVNSGNSVKQIITSKEFIYIIAINCVCICNKQTLKLIKIINNYKFKDIDIINKNKIIILDENSSINIIDIDLDIIERKITFDKITNFYIKN